MGCERTFKAEATTNTKERMEHWHREGQQESEGAEGTLRRPVCYVESTKSEIVAYSPLPTAIEVAITSRPMVFQTPLWSSYHSTDEATAL